LGPNGNWRVAGHGESRNSKSGRGRVFHRPVPVARQQPGNRNVLIQFLPVQSVTARTDLLARSLSRSGGQQSGEPCQRHANGTAVRETDPHCLVVEPDPVSRNGHTMPFRSVPSARRRHERCGRGLDGRSLERMRPAHRVKPEFRLSTGGTGVDIGRLARIVFVREEEKANSIQAKDGGHSNGAPDRRSDHHPEI